MLPRIGSTDSLRSAVSEDSERYSRHGGTNTPDSLPPDHATPSVQEASLRSSRSEDALRAGIRELAAAGSVENLMRVADEHHGIISDLAAHGLNGNREDVAAEIRNSTARVSHSIDEVVAQLEQRSRTASEAETEGAEAAPNANENIDEKRGFLLNLKNRLQYAARNAREFLLGTPRQATAEHETSESKKSFFGRPWVVAFLASAATITTLAVIGAIARANHKPKLIVIREPPSNVPPLRLPPPQAIAHPVVIAPRPQQPPHPQNQQPIIAVMFPNNNSLN